MVQNQKYFLLLLLLHIHLFNKFIIQDLIHGYKYLPSILLMNSIIIIHYHFLQLTFLTILLVVKNVIIVEDFITKNFIVKEQIILIIYSKQIAVQVSK
jgi:hypothetical protein